MFKYIVLSLLLLISGQALAAISVDDMQQKLEQFKQSPDAIYAKTTLERAQAYMGAAMIARDHEDKDAIQEALAKVQATLDEAKQSAQRFKTQFAELLNMQTAAHELVTLLGYHNNPLEKNSPTLFLKKGDQAIQKVIQTSETAQLNASQQAAGSARSAYKHVFDTALPDLIEKTGEILSSAAAKGGKFYAPVTYGKAKEAWLALKSYQDGVLPHLPPHPAHALELAQQAFNIATQVKQWRRDKGSHEMLLLRARDERVKLASILHLPLQHDDISPDTVINAVQSLQTRLQNTEQSSKAKFAQLKQEYDQKLTQALEEQRIKLLHAQNDQVSQMKEAFRAKLERETFETKRQKRAQALFSKKEVSIVANLDGSLILRLSSLKFPPGSSKIDTKYFDLLARVKQVLDIYGDRTFRIEGHTDNQGDLKANQRLSLKRAESVRDFLIAAGADGSSLKALGYGEVRPIASNDFAKGREMNRRIDLVIEAPHDQ